MSSRGRAGCERRARHRRLRAVISPRTAMSQTTAPPGSSPLREATEIDPRYGAISTATSPIASSLHADIGEIEVGLINQPDLRANSMGIKGLGEVVLSERRRRSSTRFISATGRRIRHAPVRIEIFCDRRRACNMAAALKP